MKTIKNILWVLALLLAAHMQAQQVTVNTTLIPPTSSSINDFNSISKVNVLFISNMTVSGFAQVTISGNNGITISNNHVTGSYTTSNLSAGIPASITSQQLNEVFNIANLVTSGMNSQQQQAFRENGSLPDGVYSVCFEFWSGRSAPVKISNPAPNGCANWIVGSGNSFSNSLREPPRTIIPACQTTVSAIDPQQLVFTWLDPSAFSDLSRGPQQYLIKMVEVPGSKSPYDAIASSSVPPLFEKTVFGTSYVYGIADPPLKKGAKYAYVVSVKTDNRKYQNNGVSEVCWFTYGKNELQSLSTTVPLSTTSIIPEIKNKTNPIIPKYDPEMPPNIMGNLTDIGPSSFIPFLPSNIFYGKLKYKYRSEDAGPNVEFPLKNAQIELRVKYALINSQTGEIDWEGYHPGAPKPAEGIFQVPEGQVIATVKTGADGNFSFWLPEDMTFGKVSSNYKDYWIDGGGQYHDYEDQNNPGSSSFHSGDLYRMVQINVVGEHFKYYLDPKEYIDLSNAASKNATYYAYPRSKQLTVTLKTWDLPSKYMESMDKPAGMKVYLLRKTDMQDADIFPLGDGYADNSGDENNTEKITVKNKEYYKVAEAISNQDGIAVFQRVIWQRPDVNNYYIYADAPEGSQMNYYMMGPKLHYTKEYYNNGNYEKGYTYDNVQDSGIVIAGYPKISGTVTNIPNNLPINDAMVMLTEWYDFNSGNSFDRDPDDQHALIQNYFNQKGIEDAQNAAIDLANLWGNNIPPVKSSVPDKMPVILIQNTDQSGNFSFKDLFLQVNKSAKTVTGPSRSLIIGSAGYEGEFLDNLNNNTPLRYGQKLEYSIKLLKGSNVFLRVEDGDSGDGLEGVEVYFEGDGMSYLTVALGFIGFPAKKLPNQKLVFYKEGYLPYSVNVDVDKSAMSLGTFKLYSMKRRVDVKVIDANDNTTAIPNARVEIKNLMANCQQNPKGSGSGKFKYSQTNIDNDCPYSKLTDKFGMSSFVFENAGTDNSIVYTIVVTGPAGQNYETEQVSSLLPNAADPTNILVKLKPATCIKGTVYAGETNNSPISGAVVKMKQNMVYLGYSPFIDEGGNSNSNISTPVPAALLTTSGSNGSFELHNVPVRNYAQYVEGYKSESNFVGDTKKIKLETASNTCINVDLHLKVFNDMDITNLMGFPMAVTNLSSSDKKSATVTGYFTKLPEFGNEQFGVVSSIDNTLSFTNLIIIADPSLKNANGIPVSKPETLPLKTNENDLHIYVYNTPAVLKDNKIGVHLDKSTSNQIYGVIKGKITLPNTSINSNNFSFSEDVFLAQPNKPKDEKLYIPAIYADKSVTKPVVTDKGLLVCNADGQSAQIILQSISKGLYADADNTWFLNGNFLIDATFHTNITTLDEPDLNVKIKGMKVNKNKGLQPFNSSQEIAAKLNKWDLKSTDWILDGQGVKLKKFNVYTNGNSGLIVPGTDITIKYDELNTGLTKVNLDGLTLPGGKPIKILGGNSGFNNTLVNGKKLWQIYVIGANMNTAAAQIENLDGWGNIPFKLNSIMLTNDGKQKIIMGDNPAKVHNAVDFTPTANTALVLENSYMMISGSLTLNLPDAKDFPATLMYKLPSPNPTIESINMNLIKWTQNGLYVEVKKPTLTPGLFQAKGFVEEQGTLPKVNVTLNYSPASVDLPIDAGQKIAINGNDKYFDDVKGEMHIDKGSNKWTTFWFDGALKGMPGISDVNDKKTNLPQRMRMTCNGAITADAQSISVKNVETPFGNMSWIYDMPNASLHGSCILNSFDIGGMKLDGTLETEVGSKGWYFVAGGSVNIPVLGGGNMLAFFGDYSDVPKLSGNPAGLGTYKCLPPDFQSQVKGVLISAGINKNIIDPQDYALPVIDIGFHAHVTAGITGRFYTSFNGSSGTNYNIGLMANISAGGEVDIGCIEVGGNATLEASINGNYDTKSKTFSIVGCESLEIGLKGQICVVPVNGCLGLADCCVGCLDPLEAMGIDHLTLGAQVNANSSGDYGFDFIWKSCSESACK